MKAWPALVGFAGFVAFAPALTDWALTAEPPLELNVTVKVALGAEGLPESTTKTLEAWARVAVPRGSTLRVPSAFTEPESTPAAEVHVRASLAQESTERQSVVDLKGAGSG